MMEKIILFGTGKYFNTKRNVLQKYHITEILDNRVSKGENIFFEDTNIRIVNPADMGSSSDKIFLMSMHFVSMWKQLVELGVETNRIVYPFFLEPFFQSDEVVYQCVDEITFSKDKICVECKNGSQYYCSSQEEWNDILRKIYSENYPIISAISNMDTTPISEQFGTERGTPVDRYYIEYFLNMNANKIQGDVLEIEDNNYTKKYGNNYNSIVMDVSSKADNIDFNANLETGEGIIDNIADCFICTQTLMYIFDLKKAAHNIGRLLKKDGVALITCSGLSQNSRRCMENYGAYWGFNEAVFKKMFSDETSLEVVDTGSYGNIKTVVAHISGLCFEDLEEKDFVENDLCYPLIVYAVVRKHE